MQLFGRHFIPSGIHVYIVIQAVVVALGAFILFQEPEARDRHALVHCRGNLSMIDMAKRTFLEQHDVPSGYIVTTQDLATVIPSTWFDCISGGRYIIGTVGEGSRCSIHLDASGATKTVESTGTSTDQ